MNIRHLQIFISVCDHGNSITHAAKSLYMTQPSVSQAIQELENYYGVRLFDRMSRRLYLTAAGEEFREYALRLTGLYDDMEKRFKNWDESGALRVGASMTAGCSMMPPLIRVYQDKHPETEVKVMIEPSRILQQKLVTNELDLAIVETSIHSTVLREEKFGEDILCIIAPPSTDPELFSNMSGGEFASQRFLLREQGSGSREIFEQVMRNADLSAEPVWEAQSTTALINAVAQGMGISVLPRLLVQDAVRAGNVREVTVRGLRFKQNFYVVHHKDKLMTGLIRDFISTLMAFPFSYDMLELPE
ncbi:MAG: LysR family transcriptional regulator [Lachnospiraceae bacterium]|nr:LysR family transcriptional regulator [Lachnospiraceae bacterium]